MADLNYVDRDLEVKIVGQDATGNTANYVGADANGNMFVKDYSCGPVTPGSAASASSLIGGQFNTVLPTLTTGQQSALQLNASGSLNVAITAGAGSITATVGSPDKTAFTYGTTVQLPIGGVYQDTSPALTAGTSGAVRLTQYRAQHVNLRDSSGNEKLGQTTMSASIPVVIASDQSTVPVSFASGNTVNIKDSAGNSLASTTNALNTYITGGRSEEHTSELQSLRSISYDFL